MVLQPWQSRGFRLFPGELPYAFARKSVQRPHTLLILEMWVIDSLQTYASDLLGISPNAQFVLAANKCDLTEQQQLSEQQVEDFATALDAPYHLTSAKTGDEVDTLFRRLGRRIST